MAALLRPVELAVSVVLPPEMTSVRLAFAVTAASVVVTVISVESGVAAVVFTVSLCVESE